VFEPEVALQFLQMVKECIGLYLQDVGEDAGIYLKKIMSMIGWS
jgi:hypothetical protein